MSQKLRIMQLLHKYGVLTQRELAFHIYNDYNHFSSIYSALKSLVVSNDIIKITGHSARYLLNSKKTDEIQSLEIIDRSSDMSRMQCTGNVILLNKPFLGGWLNNQGNIGHEIIDFLCTDDGDYYVYNNPWGVCPNDIWINGTTELQRKKCEKYLGKYLVLTSNERGNEFDILYVIKLSSKLHRYHTTKAKDKTEFRKSQQAVKQIIRDKNIKYNGRYLDEIYGYDDSLYLTFKGNLIYKATNPILVNGLTYNFQRNKGYLYDDKFPTDYKRLLNIIESSIENKQLVEFNPRSVSPEEIGTLNSNRTFINLIRQEDNEQIFTNILHSILEQGDMLKRFCERFRENKLFNSNEDFTVLREVKVVDGRLDICAEGNSQRIIIENKINSGLNGLRPADNTTQLSTYYNWGIEKPTHPLCFVVAPNYRCSEIKREIQEKDQKMESIYIVKTYSEIAEFLYDEYKAGAISCDYAYYSLIPQIIDAFKNLSLTKEEIYARMFLEATN